MTERDSPNKLYDEARAESGQLVVYAGGDAPEQAAMYTSGFTELFPVIDIEVTVDLSKYHDGRIDAAHLRGDNRVDVVHLQTLHDYPYPADKAPREAADYLRPELKGRIVLVYPHDDDAVLYQFEQIIARHGIEWLQKLQ